jgi:tetratricopeptide (TPR) repeat protein
VFGRVFIVVFTLAAGVASAVRAAPQTTRDSTDIPTLIQSLGDPDSAVRRDAIERLSDLPDARPQVIAAMRTGDPEQRARAADVLRRLPWFLPSDPPFIQSVLQSYGAAPDDNMRSTIVERLASDEAGAVILIRLLIEEPSELIRWRIVDLLVDDRELNTHRHLRDAKFQKKLRELDVTQDDPAILVVVGKAWLERDRNRALGLFRRAIDTDQTHPASDHGVLSVAYDELIAQHLRQRQFDQAAELLRRQIPRDPSDDQSSWNELNARPSLASLAALHRYFGPLRGFSEDLRTWSHPAETPATAPDRRIADLMMQLGAPAPLPAGRGFELSAQDHLAAGDFLYHHKFLPAADLELRQALVGAKDNPQRFTEFYAALLLGKVAAESGRDADAAEFYEKTLRAKLEGNFRISDDELQTQIHYRRARIAQARNDLPAANREVQDLLQQNPGSNDETIAVIRWLKETNRPEQAKVMFDKIFEQSKSQLDAEDFKAGLQNDLAWLCARCNERLDLALELSHAAVEASPETAAFLDTAAEANYRKGNVDEAIRLETRALELSPDNDFMREQLQRFKSRQP